MYVFITVLILIAAVLLTLIVLIQNSKGGGLASGFSSSNQIMGVRKTTDFLEKATWGLAIGMAVLCVAITAFLPKQGTVGQSEIQQQVNETPTVDPSLVAPDFGTAQPTTTPAQPAQTAPATQTTPSTTQSGQPDGGSSQQ